MQFFDFLNAFSILKFFKNQIGLSNLPGQNDNKLNAISLGFFSEFLNHLESPKLDSGNLFTFQQMKVLLQENYSKFNLEASLHNSSVVQRSNLVVVLKNQLDMFKFSEKLNEKGNQGGLEVMPIISSELIKSRESSNNSSLDLDVCLNDKDFLKSEIVKSKNYFLSSLNSKKDLDNSRAFDNSFVSETSGIFRKLENDDNFGENMCSHDSSLIGDSKLDLSDRNLLKLKTTINPNPLETSSYAKKKKKQLMLKLNFFSNASSLGGSLFMLLV